MAATALSGCASMVSKTDTTTYIQTEPETARCELHGQDFTRVLTTPASISLPANAAPITVACSASGYRTSTATLDTSIDGWVFGNILFGGLIGLAVDVARGAGEKFPPQFTVILEPERFASQAERDAYYDRRRDEATVRWDKALASIEQQCRSATGGDTAKPSAGDCDKRLAEAREKRGQELGPVDIHLLARKAATRWMAAR